MHHSFEVSEFDYDISLNFKTVARKTMNIADFMFKDKSSIKLSPNEMIKFQFNLRAACKYAEQYKLL